MEQLKTLVPSGVSLAQFALRWILEFPAVTCAIPGGKRPTAVVVALDGKDTATLGLLRRFKNYKVSDIAEGEDEISGLGGEFVSNPVVIGELQEFHLENR